MSFCSTLSNGKNREDALNEAPVSIGGSEILPSPSSFHADLCKYDVFLSFRGEDTRRNFTDHLYAALLRKGVNTFMDDKELQRGESITAEIWEAIQQSKSSIIVFSRNYASSSWCLEELVKIVECKRRRGHVIFPIFYDVDPSAVRKQTGSFRKAFDKHKWAFWNDKTKLQQWRSALVEVANISGWNAKDRLESQLIEEVARKIAVKLRPIPSNYNYVPEVAEIDRCLETLSSYVASTIFLRSKEQAGCLPEVFPDSILQQTAYSWAGERPSVKQQATCYSEEGNESAERQYLRVEEHVRRLTSSLLKKYPLQSLIQATDNFSSSFMIGRGGFGFVYRGTLEDNSVVAIKRPIGKHKDRAFLQELEFSSRLHHKNIVRLSGFHVDRFERILVFEYQANNSLFNHLFLFPDSPLKSSWAARLKAALDLARGLEYLHEYAVPPIIHRDVKSSNVLFDSKWTAKVADFGLSLVVPSGREVDCEVCGTVGYMDPEYYRLGRVTTKSDVYGFGVVLLELLSGQKAGCRTCENGEELVALVDLVVPDISQGRIQDVLDPRAALPTLMEMEALRPVGELAVDCVNPESRFRPSMSEITSCLLKVSSPLT